MTALGSAAHAGYVPGSELDRAFALGDLLDSPGFWERAAAAGAGEYSPDRHRLVDESQRDQVLAVLDPPRRCPRSRRLLYRTNRQTGSMSFVWSPPCKAFVCPYCGPLRQAEVARAIAASKVFRSVITITLPRECSGDPSSLIDWERLFGGNSDFRRLMKKLLSFCSGCRKRTCRSLPLGSKRRFDYKPGAVVSGPCPDCAEHPTKYGPCARCCVATWRKRRNCKSCLPRHLVQFCAVPEWNTHLSRERGRLHCNFLSDIPWGPFNLAMLSAALERSGLGTMTAMTEVVDASHVVKDLGATRAGRRHMMNATEAARYSTKDMAEGGRPGGRAVVIPRGRRRVSSNVINLPRCKGDPSYAYRLVRYVGELAAWLRNFVAQQAFGVGATAPSNESPGAPAATAEPPPSAPPRAPPYQFGFGFPFPHFI